MLIWIAFVLPSCV